MPSLLRDTPRLITRWFAPAAANEVDRALAAAQGQTAAPLEPEPGALAAVRARAQRVHRAVMTGFVLLVSALLGTVAYVLLGEVATMAAAPAAASTVASTATTAAAADLSANAQAAANLLRLQGYCAGATLVFCLALGALLAHDVFRLVRRGH